MAVSTGTYASRPSSHSAGDIYLTTDSFWDYLVSDGTKWKHLYGGFLCEPPIDSEFSWVNQGGATVSTANGGVFLRAPAGASTNLRIRVKSAPAAPYVLTGVFMPTLAGGTNTSPADATCGLLVRNSSNEYLVTIEIGTVLVGVVYGYRLAVRYLQNPTTHLSVLYHHAIAVNWSAPAIWLQIEDDNTNLHYRFSLDGQNFIDLYSQGRASLNGSAPNQIGFFAHTATTSYDAGATLIHWSQPNPVSSLRVRAFFLGSGMATGYGSGSVAGAFG